MDITKLSKKEKALYLKIINVGTMEDMFKFGYVIGRASLAEEELKRLKTN